MNLHALTLHAAAALLRSGEIRAVELTESVLDRIYALDNTVKAYLALTPEAGAGGGQPARTSGWPRGAPGRDA